MGRSFAVRWYTSPLSLHWIEAAAQPPAEPMEGLGAGYAHDAITGATRPVDVACGRAELKLG